MLSLNSATTASPRRALKLLSGMHSGSQHWPWEGGFERLGCRQTAFLVRRYGVVECGSSKGGHKPSGWVSLLPPFPHTSLPV